MKIDVASPSGAKMRNDIMFSLSNPTAFISRLLKKSSLKCIDAGKHRRQSERSHGLSASCLFNRSYIYGHCGRFPAVRWRPSHESLVYLPWNYSDDRDASHHWYESISKTFKLLSIVLSGP
jgi:hypothetical protein